MSETNISRRDFMVLMGATSAAVLVPAEFAIAANSKVLVSCLDEDPVTLNTAISTSIPSLMASSPVYSALIRVDQQGNLIPDLASSWSSSEDGLTYTFKLREGVKWHDGTPFTSGDCKFTIEEMIAPLQPIGKNAFKHLAGVDAPDEHTLVVRFKQVNQPYLKVPQAHGPILPKHLWQGTNFTQNPHSKKAIGTGPFKITEYRIGEEIRYARYQDYHLKGQPAFDELVLRIIPDAVSRSAAFENGEIDTVQGLSIPFTDIARLRQLPNVQTVTNPYPGGTYIALFNLREKTLSDQKVRQAIAFGVDRKFMRENILPNISRNMVGPLYPASPLHNSQLVDYEFDPARANQLLDDAGYPRGPDGVRFTVRIAWQNVLIAVTRMADVMRQNLKDIGIDAQLKPMETPALIQNAYIEGDFDILIGSYALGPDPDIGMERLYNSANIKPLPYTNNSNYRSDEVDALFDKQRLTTTFDARKAIYDGIQATIWKDLPTLPLCSYDLVSFINALRATNCYERIWNPLAEDFGPALPTDA